MTQHVHRTVTLEHTSLGRAQNYHIGKFLSREVALYANIAFRVLSWSPLQPTHRAILLIHVQHSLPFHPIKVIALHYILMSAVMSLCVDILCVSITFTFKSSSKLRTSLSGCVGHLLL